MVERCRREETSSGVGLDSLRDGRRDRRHDGRGARDGRPQGLCWFAKTTTAASTTTSGTETCCSSLRCWKELPVPGVGSQMSGPRQAARLRQKVFQLDWQANMSHLLHLLHMAVHSGHSARMAGEHLGCLAYM